MEAVKSNYYAGNIPYNSTIEGTISYQGIWGINGYTYPEGKDYCSFILHKYGDDRTVHIRNMNGTWNFVEEATKDDLLSIDVKKYTSGALSKGSQKEINLTFEPRTGYTRRYFVGELSGTGSNSAIVNAHGSTLSFFAFDRDADITATILCIYTKD